MIRVLGTKRILMLVFLIAINVAMATTVYMYLIPQQVKKERELKKIRGDVNTTRDDISRMQVEFDQLAEQQNQFEKLKAKGFFYDQGRLSVLGHEQSNFSHTHVGGHNGCGSFTCQKTCKSGRGLVSKGLRHDSTK